MRIRDLKDLIRDEIENETVRYNTATTKEGMKSARKNIQFLQNWLEEEEAKDNS